MRILLKRLWPFAICFLLLQTIVRITLIITAWEDIDSPLLYIPRAMITGLWFDLVVLSLLLLPLVFYWLVLPVKWQSSRADKWFTRIAFALFSFVFLFTAVSEYIFWDEFGVRFNFIAVDYLVYTNEVLGNIYESYPVIPLISGMVGLCILATWFCRRRLAPAYIPVTFRKRLPMAAACIVLAVAAVSATSLRYATISNNTFTNEIAANGIYNLFWAYGHNEIDYRSFYLTRQDSDVDKHIRTLLEEDSQNFDEQDPDGITRVVYASEKEQRKNIVVVVMESMSAAYMDHFGSTQHLTPNLDRLSEEGLLFTKLYATGTRTVRGLEAVTLSIPPTPGQSIVRRPGNENLFSSGFIFKDRGYDTAFIYGGYGYFDNMNYFFEHNGFDIVDRNDMPKQDIQFGNVWGVSDEDLFATVLKKADASYASGKPFFHTIMTTSNHRPYTYPDGRIDIVSGTSRLGGVKYADYAVGKLIEDASKKPWFKNTLFVFVADHTAGASGKVELAAEKYHIPLIFYAPGFIKPQKFETIASQIDIMPMILGQIGFSYRSRFFGEDLLHDADEIPRAFISNYQKVAIIKQGQTTILAPKRQLEAIIDDQKVSKDLLNAQNVADAITYYQYASNWRERSRRIDTMTAPQAHSATGHPAYAGAPVR
jgi:phosphoglycerol transferase MdoB-like AlkP superfamily enzyme